MKPIDRLIIKAKKKCGADGLTIAFIYPSDSESGKWIARGDIWNGVSGSGMTSAICTCLSVEDALQALEELSEKHPNNKDVPIIIENLDG
ncbi:hypothetical protein [Lachnoclostridium sp. An14]|uniref:hypothetical protein n=1 Tax=Lachnoclostridium sp. An14 TaxID=1965562 RepID=UPI00117A85A3|nr:hypothetical protein [Lachnoclostridium sp. An14]